MKTNDIISALWRSEKHTHFFGKLDRDTGQFRNFIPKDEATAADMAIKLSESGEEIYFAPAHYATPVNRTQSNAVGAHAFWIDIDCGEKKAAEGKGYADIEQAKVALKKFCHEAGLSEPDILINSGSGVHAYWSLTEFVPKDQWQDYARKLKAVMAKLGFLADPSRTADIASVLRIPGTQNHKYQPTKLVTVLQFSEHHIANAVMFTAIESAHTRLCGAVAATPKQSPSVSTTANSQPSQGKEFGPLDLERLKSAYAVLDPDCDESTWKFHRICPLVREAKLHPEKATELKALARQWSSGELRGDPSKAWTTPGATNKPTGEQAFEQVWNRFMTTTYEGREVTVGTVFKHAAELGWRYTSSDSGQQNASAPKLQSSVAIAAKAPVSLVSPQVTQEVSEETEEETMTRLAAMSRMEYGRIRVETAKRLGVTTKTLDDTVKALNKERNAASNLPFVVHEAAFDPVDPKVLFTEISRAIRTHIVLEPEQADAATLWSVQTHMTDDADVSPPLMINAPERACAKTLLQQLLGLLTRNALFASNASMSALFRSIEKWSATLMIDEADTFFRDNSELHGMVNAGYKKGGFVLRSEAAGDSYEPKMFNVYGAKCIAGISLEKHLPDATMSRGIVINMRRKMVHEKVERMRNLDKEQFERLGSQIARFAQDYQNRVRAARPQLPEELSDRAQDNWEPLLAIASCAGEEWLKRATDAALKLSAASDEKSSTSNDLLADIKTVLFAWDRPTVRTQELIDKLNNDADMGWNTYSRGKPLTPRNLAKLLEAYAIKPKTVRQKNGTTPKGYECSDFRDAFDRYLKPEATPSEVAATAQRPVDPSDLDVAIRSFEAACCGVADTSQVRPGISDEPVF